MMNRLFSLFIKKQDKYSRPAQCKGGPLSLLLFYSIIISMTERRAYSLVAVE